MCSEMFVVSWNTFLQHLFVRAHLHLKKQALCLPGVCVCVCVCVCLCVCACVYVCVCQTLTSGCSSQKSLGSWKNSTFSFLATAPYGEREVASTRWPRATKRSARNWPKLPKPSTPIVSCFCSLCLVLALNSKSKGWAASMACTLRAALIWGAEWFSSALAEGPSWP